jgi:hypothetical protein
MLWFVSHTFYREKNQISHFIFIKMCQCELSCWNLTCYEIYFNSAESFSIRQKICKSSLCKIEFCSIQNGGYEVKVKFTLNMENLTVSSRQQNQEEENIDRLIISWISNISEKEVLNMSSRWIGTKDFLTQRMTDLKKVGESSLTIEPVEEMKV